MEIQELVAAPISLTLATVIDGAKFYSSDTLKEKFILAFDKSSKGKHITNEMNKLVQNNLVLPCYKSKNLFGFIKRKLFKRDASRYILGFYHVEEKRVIVLVENSVSIFGTAANNELVSTTMHECMHLIAGRNLNKFMNIFRNFMRLYYIEFLKDYYQIENVDKKKVDDLIRFISVFERKGPGYANSKLSDYYKFLFVNFSTDSKLEEDEFQRRTMDLVVAIKLFVRHLPSLLKNARKYAMLFTSLNHAYFNAFGKKNTYTTPIQELISVSEIACVLSEMHPQDAVIKKLFQIIA